MAETANRMSNMGSHFPVASGGGNVHEYMKFLGPPTGNLSPTAYDKQNFTHYDLQEAYKGRNLFLADTVTGLVMENNTWYTRNALPWVQSDQLHFQWHEWKMTEGILPRVPHEGVSRLITSQKHVENAHSVRRGGAFTMEGDFYRTDEGRTHYLRNLVNLSQQVQETQDFDTLFSLMSTKTYDQMYQERFGLARISYVDIIEEESLNYACGAMPEHPRLNVLIEEAIRTMAKVGVEPNMLILGPKAKIAWSVGDKQATEYWTAGPEGSLLKRQGPDALGSIRGLQVFQTRDIHSSSDSPAVQLLTRRSQIAEFYDMVLDDLGSQAAYDFTTESRNLYIFDENNSDMAKVTFLEAFENCGIFSTHSHDEGYSQATRDIVKQYNARGQLPQHMPGSADGMAGPHYPPAFFLTMHDGSVWDTVTHFGQLEMRAATHQDFQRIGESIVGNPNLGSEHYRELVDLVHNIEMQPYSDAFFEALIRVNVTESVNVDGEFVGERTPEELAAGWGVQSLQEWAPNGVGGMRLPRSAEFANMGFPPGFANGPGLRTLAMEASHPESPWHEAGKQAQRGLSTLSSIVATLQKILPDAEALDPVNRAPWFHRDDALTVFFSNVFSVPRDPLFLLHLPVAGSGEEGRIPRARGAVRAGASAGAGGNLPWVTLPDGNRQVYSAILGDISLSPALVAAVGGTVGREAQVVSLMPSGDAAGADVVRQANLAILREINTNANYGGDSARMAELRRKYETLVVMWMMGASAADPPRRHEVWQAIAQMGTLAQGGDFEALEDAISRSYTGPDTATRSREARDAQARRNALRLQGQTLVGDLTDTPTLYDTWVADGMVPSAGAEEGAARVVATALQEPIDAVFDAERDLRNMARASGVTVPVFSEPFSTASVAEARATARAIGEDEATDLADAIATGVGTVLTAIPEATPVGEASPGVFVLDTPTTRAGSAYYRTPLTSSKALVASISAQFGRTTNPPLVLPGDPATANTLPLGGRDGSVPVDILLRTNYADLASVISGRMKRDLGDTAMVSRRAAGGRFDLKNPGAAAAVFSSSATGLSTKFNDSEEDGESSDDSDEETLEGMFSASRVGAPARKRSKNLAVGAHRPPPVAIRVAGVDTPTFRERWQKADEIVDPFARMAVHTFMTARADNRRTWTAMIAQDAIVPLSIVLWRLVIEHDMMSMIVMRGGIETGANVYGHSNFEVGADVNNKMLYANFTFYAKAIVWKKHNVQVLMDIQPDGYHGGSSMKFARHTKEFRDLSRDRASIIAVPLPLTESKLDRFMNFAGPMQEAVPDLNSEIDGTPDPTYSSYEFAEMVWKFSKAFRHATAMGSDTFYSRADRPTLVATRGTILRHNNKDKAFTRLSDGAGHRAGKVYPGASPVWNGAYDSFKPFDWSQRRFE